MVQLAHEPRREPHRLDLRQHGRKRVEAFGGQLFDDQASTSIGDIAVAPSNPDVVWVGTGEANLFRASMPGLARRSDRWTCQLSGVASRWP